MKFRVVGGLVATWVLVFAGSCAAHEPLHYEPAIVHLSGTIYRESHYGPPNFGENPDTDTREVVIVLEIDSPVTVTADPHADSTNIESYSEVKKVQLLGSKTLDLAAQIGRRVTLEGTLFEHQSGEHFTDVLMNVLKVTPASYSRGKEHPN